MLNLVYQEDYGLLHDEKMKLKNGWGQKGLVMAVKNYVLYELRIFKRKQMSTYTY